MRISKAIVATEGTPMYSDCWPIVAQAWNNLGITPVVANIGKKWIDESLGVCIDFENIPGIPSSFVSQVIRMIIPAFFPDEVCILSDVDMVPMNKAYFTKRLEDYSNDSLLILSSDAYGVDNKFPMCYIVAKGKVFQQIIGLENTKIETINDFIRDLYKLDLGWITDEVYLGQRIYDYSKDHEVVLLNRFKLIKKYPRLDRSNWKINLYYFITNKYVDCHLLRPPLDHKEELKLINIFVANQNDGFKSFLIFLSYILKFNSQRLIS